MGRVAHIHSQATTTCSPTTVVQPTYWYAVVAQPPGLCATVAPSREQCADVAPAQRHGTAVVPPARKCAVAAHSLG